MWVNWPFFSEPGGPEFTAAAEEDSTQPFHLKLLVLPYLQASVGGQGAGIGLHCLPLTAIRDPQAKNTLPVRDRGAHPAPSDLSPQGGPSPHEW